MLDCMDDNIDTLIENILLSEEFAAMRRDTDSVIATFRDKLAIEKRSEFNSIIDLITGENAYVLNKLSKLKQK